MLLNLILSTDSSYETRACYQGSMLLDQTVKVWRISYEELSNYTDLLKDSTTLPVGSVEYLMRAMELANKILPSPLSYMDKLIPFLGRNIQLMSKEKFLEKRLSTYIYKTMANQKFTGFCYRKNKDYTSENEHIEHESFLSLPQEEEIWVSEIIPIEQEWRCYIKDNEIIGYARYDYKDVEDAIDLNTVRKMITAAAINHPYTLDVGQSNGKTILVEANDAWAIGYYSGSIKPKEYLNYLYARWLSI